MLHDNQLLNVYGSTVQIKYYPDKMNVLLVGPDSGPGDGPGLMSALGWVAIFLTSQGHSSGVLLDPTLLLEYRLWLTK